jgi:hypothetical protein
MAWGQPLGLDELMIVNPSTSDTEAYLLGEDGTLYQVEGLGSTETLEDSGQYFLGDDGTLYQLQGLQQTEDLQGSRQYFLGDDGTLYQLQGKNLGEISDISMGQHSCQCMKK